MSFPTTGVRRARAILLCCWLGLVLAGVPATPPAAAEAQVSGAGSVPVFAYYYIWFTPSSWNRAKSDLPLLGAYNSDDEAVMRLHIQWAKAVGIDGFLVSWKDTDALSPRLATLVRVAREEQFKLAINYESLDFYRNPLPIAQVSADLGYFVHTYGNDEVFDAFGKPLVVWAGTWEYGRDEIAQVTDAYRDRLQILASQKQPDAYVDIADLVDGNAYYWSSVNPETYPTYGKKLQRMADAVHQNGGLWIAPAAPGFDARHLGGESEVPRDDGATLETELTTAMASQPDAIGLISWNEFSENSHIEPSCRYGDRYLDVLANLIGGVAPSVTIPCDEVGWSAAQAGTWSDAPVPTPPPVASADTTNLAFEWDSSSPREGSEPGSPLRGALALAPLGLLAGFSLLLVLKRSLQPARPVDGHERADTHDGAMS